MEEESVDGDDADDDEDYLVALSVVFVGRSRAYILLLEKPFRMSTPTGRWGSSFAAV